MEEGGFLLHLANKTLHSSVLCCMNGDCMLQERPSEVNRECKGSLTLVCTCISPFTFFPLLSVFFLLSSLIYRQGQLCIRPVQLKKKDSTGWWRMNKFLSLKLTRRTIQWLTHAYFNIWHRLSTCLKAILIYHIVKWHEQSGFMLIVCHVKVTFMLDIASATTYIIHAHYQDSKYKYCNNSAYMKKTCTHCIVHIPQLLGLTPLQFVWRVWLCTFVWARKMKWQ